ncbi:MAG: PEP-CTERM sorting domain-containing protein, partial [Akkermansia sp.]
VGDNVTWVQDADSQTITYADGVLTLAQAVKAYYINDATTDLGDYSSASKIIVAATNGTVSLTSATSADITVNSRAVLDLSGQMCGDCDLVLAGGSLTNNGTRIEASQKQLNSLTLTANSTVNAEADKYYGVVASGWSDTFIDLGGYILTKTGAGQFYAASTNLRGGGTLKITSGDFNLGVLSGSAGVASIGHTGDTKDTNIWFTGGTLSSGKGINLNRNVEFLAKAEDGSTAGVTGTISAALNIGTNTATFKANSQNDKLIISGMISGSGKITVDGAGEVQYKNSTTGANQDLANSVVEIKSSAKLNLLATWKLHTYLGVLTGDGTLQSSCASNSDQADGYRATVISGDASGFTGEWLLETASGTDNGVTSNRRVSGVLNTGTFGGVVKFTGSNGDATKAGSQLLLAQDTSIAGLEGSLTNAVVKGITYITTGVDDALRNDSFTVTERTLTIAGNKNLSFSGKVNSSVSLVVGDGTNAASQTFDGATIGGSMELKKQATVTATGDTTIATLTGTGTLTASSGEYSEVKDASSFTGTLTATDDATLQVGKVDSLAAIDSASTGGIWLMDSASSVTVGEIVLSGSMVGVSYTIPADPDTGSEASVVEATVSTGSLTVSGDSTLYANLELKENSTLKLDSALAMGSTLTLNSGIVLSGSLLDNWTERSTALTLFSGVDGLTVNGVSVSAGETNGVKASDVFGDGWSNYNLVMTGGTNNKDYNVQLVQTSDVPEPTTATLSLLALMGMAARRRRKAAK